MLPRIVCEPKTNGRTAVKAKTTDTRWRKTVDEPAALTSLNRLIELIYQATIVHGQQQRFRGRSTRHSTIPTEHTRSVCLCVRARLYMRFFVCAHGFSSLFFVLSLPGHFGLALSVRRPASRSFSRSRPLALNSNIEHIIL